MEVPILSGLAVEHEFNSSLVGCYVVIALAGLLPCPYRLGGSQPGPLWTALHPIQAEAQLTPPALLLSSLDFEIQI